MSHFLDSLNEPQRNAVKATEGPVMIIAGAGSGKTRVLTYRIAHLMELGVEPYNILALTFTNKAAAEMRQRIEKVVGNDARNLWMGTFHSVFAKILRFEAQHIGYPSNFTIYDTEDSRSLLRSIIKEFALDDKVYKVNGVHARISDAKNRLVAHEEYNLNPIYYQADSDAKRPEIGRIYAAYCQRLFRAGSMDFDDLLFNTNVLFRDHPEVLNKYQQKFHYIMVDEYQDTNISQYLITRKLAAVRQNIAVVGDDAQSIYSFRGADIRNILNFEKDYPDMQVFRLEQNYRSTQVIVEAANNVIKNNKDQLKKTVWTANMSGELIDLIKTSTDNEEAKVVASTIFEEKVREGWHNHEFAILYRTNAQSRALEEALRRMNIRYRIIGGLSFYQRKEIKDLLGYLRFIVNPNDEEALKRIINMPKRGIGDTTIARIFATAGENGVPLWDVIGNINAILTGRSATAISGFAALIRSFMVAAQEKDAFTLASQVAKETGLLRELYEDKTPEGLSRYENVQELLNAIKEFTDNPEQEDKAVGAFLQSVALLTDADAKADDNDTVTLMTIHAAKGLEFKSVFVVGLEENLFPSQMMLESRADLEEERRLFYVAITRAEKRLHLSFADSRYRFGSIINCEPSRFLDEIDTKYINMPRKPDALRNIREERPISKGTFLDQFTPRKPVAASTPKPGATHVPSPNFAPGDVKTMHTGDRVEHLKFGFGKITEMDLTGPDPRVKVVFEGLGEKTLVLAFARLMKVEG
ncbi:MAG: UvrD-helicase domain-containing protein [Bacteroidota bacterium]